MAILLRKLGRVTDEVLGKMLAISKFFWQSQVAVVVMEDILAEVVLAQDSLAMEVLVGERQLEVVSGVVQGLAGQAAAAAAEGVEPTSQMLSLLHLLAVAWGTHVTLVCGSTLEALLVDLGWTMDGIQLEEENWSLFGSKIALAGVVMCCLPRIKKQVFLIKVISKQYYKSEMEAVYPKANQQVTAPGMRGDSASRCFQNSEP